MEILFFAVLAFIAWHFFPQSDPSQPSPRYRPIANHDDCESPAEDSFLRAITAVYDLKPMGRSFLGKGLRLDLQVQEGRYRVDFLANEWLVIEIDGAAYHSSPEAIERDRVRDEYFEGLGYSVVRIPARVVFNTPRDGVERVRIALQHGKRPTPVLIEKTVWQRLSETLTSIGDGITAISDGMSRELAVDRALADARSVFGMETIIIEGAMKSAKADQEIAIRCAGDPTFAKLYTVAYAEYATLMATHPKNNENLVKDELDIKLFPKAPLLGGKPDYDAAIRSQFAKIVETRNAFLQEKITALANDAELRVLFKTELESCQCVHYWNLLDQHDHSTRPLSTPTKLSYDMILTQQTPTQ
jgi:very-short-patch-repair endonuclease